LPQAFLNAAQIAIANSNLARGRIFVKRAVSVWKTALSSNSLEVIKPATLAQDPSKHMLYRILIKWSTTVDEVLRRLEPSNFEDWLWKREKPKHPKQRVDLRDRATFPKFINLPNKNDVDLLPIGGIGQYCPTAYADWPILATLTNIWRY
jgi:hypothetical protein